MGEAPPPTGGYGGPSSGSVSGYAVVPPVASNMSLKEQEQSLQNVLSLSPVHLCGTLYLQISDLRVTADVFKRKLKSYLFRSVFTQ